MPSLLSLSFSLFSTPTLLDRFISLYTLFIRISFPQPHPTVAFLFFTEKKNYQNSIQCISINLRLLLCVFFSLSKKQTLKERERGRGKSVCLCCTNSIQLYSLISTFTHSFSSFFFSFYLFVSTHLQLNTIE